MKVLYTIVCTFFSLSLLAQAEYFDGPQTVYVGDNVSYYYNGTSGGSGSWSISGGQAVITYQGEDQVSINVLSAGPFYLTHTNSFDGYKELFITAEASIPAPPPPFVVAYQCGQTIIQMNGSPPANVEWYWQTTPNGQSTSLGRNYQRTVTSNGTYYVQAMSLTDGKWGGTSGGLFVTVNPNPNLSRPASTSLSRCGSGDVVLTTTPASGANSLKWYTVSSGGTSFGSGTPTVTVSSSTTYYASSYNTSSTCESGSRTAIPVTVGFPLTPIISLDNYQVCVGSNISGSVSFAGGAQGPVQDWAYSVSSNNGASWDEADASNLGNPFSYPANTVGIWAIKVKALINSCWSDEDTYNNINVQAYPVFTSTLTPPAICSDAQFNYTPTSDKSVYFSWSRAAVAGISQGASSGTGSISEVLSNTTESSVNVTYIYSISTGAGCTTGGQNVVVTVKPNPSTPASNSLSQCGSGDVVLTTTPASGANSLKWYTASSGGTSFGSGTPTVTVSSSTTYYASSYNTSSTCESGSRTAIPVTVGFPQTPIISLDNYLVCVGSNISGSVSFAGGAQGPVRDWAYSVSSDNGVSWNEADASNLGNPFSYPANAVGIWAIKVKALINSCWSDEATYNNIDVQAYPVFTSTLTPPAICSDAQFNYTPTSDKSVYFSWSRAAVAGISQGASSGTGSINEVLSNTTESSINVTYIYSITTGAGCTTGGQNVVVTVKPNPSAPASASLSQCGSGDVVLTTTPASGANSLKWYTASTGNTSFVGSGTPTVSVSSSTTYYASSYNTSSTCESGSRTAIPVTVGIPHTPLLDLNLSFCNWESIKISPPTPNGEIFNWYDNAGTLLLENSTSYSKPPSLLQGNFQLQFEIANPDFCPTGRATAQITITDNCDDRLNWIETQTMDDNGIISHSKSYFDLSGKPLQSQSINFTANGQVIASHSALKDKYGRDAVGMLPAPLNQTSFKYKFGFATDGSNDIFDYNDFENSPQKELGSATPGTVGWYYSENNTLETNVPVSPFPYSRQTYYPDGVSGVMQSAGVGEKLKIGSGHEAFTSSFPVANELDYYIGLRNSILHILPANALTSLAGSAVQTVVKDENGKYAVSISDKSGKTVLTARKGTFSDNVMTVTNLVTAQVNDPSAVDYKPYVYFYILDAQPVTISGSTAYTVEDLISGLPITIPAENTNWPAGFYRVVLTTGQIQLSYKNYFLDVACQFYNDAGRLISSVSPNGFVSISDGAAYSDIDKTTYTYNHRGWLLNMTEPDAGTTQYLYRTDGSIRYSQNAKQKNHTNGARFSYTLYDDINRPVESGEYKGSTYSFPGALTGTLDFGSQVQFSSVEVTDWVKTHYDISDPDFASMTGLTTTAFAQNYVRNAVSWTENVNIRTWYSYDERGRVTWMMQKPLALANRVFAVEYLYDFLGNVTQVKQTAFVGGAPQSTFYHHYEYDADKRLSKAYTSTDGTTKTLHASYKYYLHGPLKRIELGGNLQGIDFVYNIHGWLESINHPDNSKDPGQDGAPGSTFRKDVFGLLLDYYESEFTNLFPTAGIQNRNIHHLPWNKDENKFLNASSNFYPGRPDFLSSGMESENYFKGFSAENERYKLLLQELSKASSQKEEGSNSAQSSNQTKN